jgi:hypothetical protein
MSQRKQQAGVWQFLESSGLLSSGTPAEIDAARAAYWKAYRRQYNKRLAKYTITLTGEEKKELLQAAAKHHRRPTTFVKEATFAYLRTSIVLPDPAAIAAIHILLARTYSLLQKTIEDNEMPDSDTLLCQLEKLEAEILHCLTTQAAHPQLHQSPGR